MKIYVLTSVIMNGTVTLETIVQGVRANNFKEAKVKVKEHVNADIKISVDDDKMLSFTVPQPPRVVKLGMGMISQLRNEELKFIGE